MAAGCGCGCGRSAPSKREAKYAVWSIADITRDRERQEDVFQELQHAIEYLDHAPCGFFSVNPAGDIVYVNATLANWLDHDLAEIGSGGLKLTDIVSGDGASLLTSIVAGARRSQDRGVRHRPAHARRQDHAGAALSQAGIRGRRRARRLAHAGDQPRARRARRSAARRRSPLHALLRSYPDGDRDRRPRRRGGPRQRPLRQAGARPWPRRRGQPSRSSGR